MRFHILAFAAAALGLAAPAHAAIVDVSFGGTLNLYRSGCSPYTPDLPGNCTTLPIATPFTGSFTYTTDYGTYITSAALQSAAFASVGRPTTMTNTGISDRITLEEGASTMTFTNLLGSSRFVDFATLKLTFPAGALVGSTVNSFVPSWSEATGGTFDFLSFGSPGGSGPGLAGVLTSFDAVERVSGVTGAVPEPSSWVMMVAGLLLTGSALRRRTRPMTGAHATA